MGIRIAAGFWIFKMPRYYREQLRGKDLGPNEWEHKTLKGFFPFYPMGFYLPAKGFKCQKMGDLVDQCNEESVFIKVGIYSNLV